MAFVGEPPSESDPTSDPELDFSQGPGLALTGRLGASNDDSELDEPLPNGERLVAQAVEVAGADHATASLVGRFWRFAPDEELVGSTAKFAAGLGNVQRVEVLPFHQMGRFKWEKLGLDYTLDDVKAPSSASVEETCDVFRAEGLQAF